MAFKTDEDRERAKQLIAEGKKAAEVVAELDGRCTTNDVHQLKFHLKHKGNAKVKRAAKREDKPAAKVERGSLVESLSKEREKIRARVTLLESAKDVLSTGGGDLVKQIEREIELLEERAGIIASVLKNYDEKGA